MIKPITPQEATGARILPDEVMQAWNSLIIDKLHKGSARIEQEEAIRAIISLCGCLREEIFTKDYLQVDDIFKKAGWRVEYTNDNDYASPYSEPFWVFRAGR